MVEMLLPFVFDSFDIFVFVFGIVVISFVGMRRIDTTNISSWAFGVVINYFIVVTFPATNASTTSGTGYGNQHNPNDDPNKLRPHFWI